jgi:enterochelin esterase-like enzyme
MKTALSNVGDCMKIKIGKTKELSLYSAELDETVSLIVYLPASFSPLVERKTI